MPQPRQTAEWMQRALDYPYAIPAASFVQLGGAAQAPPASGPDLSGRRPLLAYGSNAAPAALARKLAALPELPLPLLRAELEDFDVVYSAHVSPYGSVPATLRPSPGTTAAVFVAYPTPAQLQLLSSSEPNYELRQLPCRLDGDVPIAVDAYVSRHGSLRVDGAEIALAPIAARGRRLATLEQPQVLELVRAQLFPDLSLEAFLASCVENGGLAPLPELAGG